MPLPPLLSVEEIRERLQAIFPEGSPNRNKCTTEIAAKTVFVMLYVGAVDGEGVWIRPDQVTRMTNAQSQRRSEQERINWRHKSLESNKGEIRGRWYAVNTRESIRDDTIRSGFVANGVVVERQGLATTSPAPRYALKCDFACLFNPALSRDESYEAVSDWQAENLSAGALARVTLVRKGAVDGNDHLLVAFPNGETRRMAPGPSSVISKAVIEVFAPRFLSTPAVIFLSESRNKVVARDDELARSIGLNIEADKNLPDIVLVDLESNNPLLVFTEIVATDGPVTAQRKKSLLQLATRAGFSEQRIVFLTAYLDRSAAAFKKTVDSLAWGSFVWFVSEPRNIVQFYHGNTEVVKTLREWP